MQVPQNLKYTKEHEWVRLEGDVAVVGITDFAQGELGDIVYVDINSVGNSLSANEVFGTVEAVKTVSDLFMPLSGTVLEVNAALNNNPEKVNADAYGEGWIIKIKIASQAEYDQLLDSVAYASITGN